MTHLSADYISSIYTYKTNREFWECSSPRMFHCLSYQASGHYDHDFSGNILSVKKDTLFFLNKKDTYTVTAKEPGIAFSVNFSASYDIPTQIIDCSSDPRFLHLFKKLQKCKALQIESNYYRAMSIIYEIISLIKEKENQSYLTSDTKLKISDMHQYISEHFTEEINIATLADNLGISTKHFSNLFKKIYGMPPNQYIISLRLNMAVSLLSQGNLNISEIANLCGFSDVYYFSRLFKKYFFKSPKAYKLEKEA